MERGRLVADGAAPGLFAQRVLDQAVGAAQGQARALTLDDLRHSLYWLATGQVSSRRIVRQAQITRLFAWLRLCLDETLLDALLQAGLTTDQAQEDARRARIAALRRWHPDPYLEAVCHDRFGGQYERPHWASLPAPAILALYLHLRSRQNDEEAK